MEWSQNGDSNKWSLNDPLKTLDPEMYNLIREEKDRQKKGSSLHGLCFSLWSQACAIRKFLLWFSIEVIIFC